MEKNMRFVQQLPVREDRPVSLKLEPFGSGTIEWQIKVEGYDTDGKLVTAIPLGIRADGTIVRYGVQRDKLKILGFQVEEPSGLIKLFN